MFEGKVTELLRQYLGDYIIGLDKENLGISVLKGKIKLENQRIRPDALNKLDLPIKVRLLLKYESILSHSLAMAHFKFYHIQGKLQPSEQPRH